MLDVATLVKPPQSRRGKGLSMVHHTTGNLWGYEGSTVYVKTQTGYNSRPSWRWWRATPTFECERHALNACKGLSINTPRVLSFRSVDGVTELVIEDIADALAFPYFWAQHSQARVQTALTELGRMVGMLHRAGWTHGAIAGAHVLVQPDHNDRVWLIDFEKARPTRSPGKQTRDLSRFIRRSPYLRETDIGCYLRGYAATQGSRQACADPEHADHLVKPINRRSA